MVLKMIFYVGYVLLSLSWICNGGRFVIRVSQTQGKDNSSCLIFNATQPCKSVGFAVRGVENITSLNKTDFTISIQDDTYTLTEHIEIIQTSPRKSVLLVSGSNRSRCVIRCENASAGITIGSRNAVLSKPTQKIHFSNLEFHNCGPHFAAVVTVWKAKEISFTNCVFKGNRQAGINALDSGVAIEGCHFENNSANVNNSIVKYTFGETSAGGAAGFLFRHAANRFISIRNSRFISNMAVNNESRHFIAPSANVTHFSTGGGGLVVVFTERARGCIAMIQNTNFTNNIASYGGGLYFASVNTASENIYLVRNCSFVRNRAGQAGGAMIISQWDTASKISCLISNCTVSDNWSRRGGGLNVFLMNYDQQSNSSVMRFDTVVFRRNGGYSSSAFRFASALPYGNAIGVIPEFINCTIQDHVASRITYTSPVMSQRVNLRFRGRNVFARNRGAGSGEYQGCVLHVHGKMEFVNNSGTHGGALLLRSSQIKLYPGSELVFLRNQASGSGGAVVVSEHTMYEFIHVNNPNCFLAYSDPNAPPSQWNTSVSFIENCCKIKGAAIYISSLERCLWSEEPPFYDPDKALRWNSKFVYQNNSLELGSETKPLSGPEYDIATDTAKYRMPPRNDSTLQLQPGEKKSLNVQGIDELNHEVYMIASLSEAGSAHASSNLLLDDNMHVIPPFTNNALPFSFRMPQKLYEEMEKQKSNMTHTITVADIYSSLKNGYTFEVRPVTCRPGFKFDTSSMECVCNKDLDGVERCENGQTIYLKEGYWANVTSDNRLVTYFCPFKYCNCTSPQKDLPGCEFDVNRPDAQCMKNRAGWLCGKCVGNTSVGLRWYKCTDCSKSGWVLGVVVPVVIGLCVLIIWLNPGISSELRGPLFFFQVLPYIFGPNSHIGEHVFVMADLFNFGGPLVYLNKACIMDGMTNLYTTAIGYLLPLVALFIFLLSYVLSANYILKFKFRKNSNLQSFWLIMLFMYNYFVETTFLLLYCPNVGGKHVFFNDGTVDCFHGNHLPMGILAILVLVTIVIPPPIIVFLLTKCYWKVDPQYVSTLTSGLRQSCCWWWSVDLCRRVLMAATYAFVVNWHTKQVLMILMCVIILAVHSNFHPYKRWRVNLTESFYLLVLCVLAIMQVFNDTEAKYIVSLVLLIIVSVHAGLLTLYKAVRFFAKRFECACVVPVIGRGIIHDPMGDSQIERSLDTDEVTRRDILDTIFSSSGEESDRRHSE